MGSLIDGRGRWIRVGAQRTVDDLLQLNAHKVMLAGAPAGRWHSTWRWTWHTWQGQQTAAIDLVVTLAEQALLSYTWQGQPVQPYAVNVATTTPHYGGVRYWWLCPRCGRRVADLYGGKLFLCRLCHGLTYRTAQAGSADIDPSVKNRLHVLRLRLRITGEDRALRPPKPARMHAVTYERLAKEYVALVNVTEQVWLAKLYSMTGLRQRAATADARAAWRQVRRDGRLGVGLYDAMLRWMDETDNPIIVDSRERRQQEAAQEAAQEWDGADYWYPDTYGPDRQTLGELATAAGVPFAFAREAVDEGLLRPDGGRGTRTKRYRRRLASWLGKLARLRDEGHSWADLRAWVRRRWQPGHEDERLAPAPSKATKGASGSSGFGPMAPGV